MVVLSSGSAAYQASPGPPGPVRLSRASGRASRKDAVKKVMQRGEAITCRGRTPRTNAEGHASAEPQTKTQNEVSHSCGLSTNFNTGRAAA